MKLFLSVTLLAALASAAPQRQNLQAQAQQFAQANNPLSAQNQAKLQKLAQQNIKQYQKTVQKEAKKYGVNINPQKIANQLQKEYGAQVKSGFNNAVKQGQQAYNNAPGQLKNNQNFQQAKNFANKATFSQVLATVQKELTNQIKKIDNPKVVKNLNALVNSGAAEAKNQLKNAGIKANANIKNTANKELKKAQNQYQGAVQEQINAAKLELNKAVKNL